VSTTTPDKCPKCGADFLSSSFGMTTFYCGSRNSYPTQHPGWLQESAFCLRHQRDQLAEKVRRLEEAAGLALGRAAKGDFESADQVLKEAKGKP